PRTHAINLVNRYLVSANSAFLKPEGPPARRKSQVVSRTARERRCSMTASELAQRLNARRSGSGWSAKCPAHDDANPSLSIKEGKDGKVLLNCFAGCSTESVVAALGLTIRWALV